MPIVWLLPEGVHMRKKLFTLFCGSVIAFSLSTAVFPQLAPAQEKMDKMGKQGRWEGNVVRSNPDKSTLTVRKVGSSDERTMHYDGATRWVSQEHGSKQVNEIDATQVKDNDRVIATGIWDKGVLYATLISKRLSH
jgi:esterase/lipase superfamily enzyme